MRRLYLKYGFTAIMMLIIVLMVLLSACSKSSSKENTANDASGKMEVNSSAVVSQEDQASNQLADKAAEEPLAPGDVAPSSDSVGGLATGEGFESFNRKLIYKANLTMEVKDYAKAQNTIRNLTTLSNGYILQFSGTKTTQEKGGTFVIKVPTDGFTSFISKLAGAYPDLQQSLQGTDVTEEYVDLTSRLKAKQAVEARLLTFMEKAERAEDLLNFSNNLGGVQEEIEQIKGRMRYLDQNVAFSTIEIRLYQPLEEGLRKAEEKEGTLIERSWDSMKQSTDYIYLFLTGLLVFIAGALPILLLLLLIGVPIYYILRKVHRLNKMQSISSIKSKEANEISDDQTKE